MKKYGRNFGRKNMENKKKKLSAYYKPYKGLFLADMVFAMIGAAITLVPMLVAVLVGRLVFNISLLDLLGTITGGMTSTPGLAAADSMVDSNIPSVAYATVYPIAMVVLILFIQIIASAVY
jgi:uncharacterized transporter YbjL